jgi:hypothetical protein
MRIRRMLCLILLTATVDAPMWAQTVQPVIVEYRGKADGKLALTNDTDAPMAVVLEAKSFSISPEGKGIFRPLDKSIHLALSSMSVKLQPKQMYYVFYSATVERLPAWFTVYATFSKLTHSPGLDVRVMLPHTVYLYQKQSLAEANVEVKDAEYSARSGKVTLTLENTGDALARVQDVKVTGNHGEAESAGFPFLPGALRRVEVDWDHDAPPQQIALRFDHFTVKRPLIAKDE